MWPRLTRPMSSPGSRIPEPPPSWRPLASTSRPVSPAAPGPRSPAPRRRPPTSPEVPPFWLRSIPTASNGAIVGRLARNADPLASGEAGNGRLNLARAASDTSTDEVQPAGAAPLGSGGPLVGPYVAAASKCRPSTSHQRQWQARALRRFTVLVESNAGGGNGVACIKVVLPTGYAIASGAVAESLISPGDTWSSPTVNTGTRTIQWAASSSTDDLDSDEWARLTSIRRPSQFDGGLERRGSAKLTGCSGGGGNSQVFTQAVVVGSIARTYSSTFRTPAGAVTTPSVTTGTLNTFPAPDPAD